MKLGWNDSRLKCLLNEQATKRDIEIALESWLGKAGADDLIVLFWAGHGYSDLQNNVYFACYDTDVAIPSTGFRMDRVRGILEERRARNVIVLADACHAGKLVTRDDARAVSVRPYLERLRTEQNVPPGWIYMVSAEPDHKAAENSAWKNGAFTYCLTKGLSGEADTNRDGEVTMLELKAYIATTMPDETLRVLGTAAHPVILTNSSDTAIWNLSLKARK
jgi:uncharacterized caspase-like protein